MWKEIGQDIQREIPDPAQQAFAKLGGGEGQNYRIYTFYKSLVPGYHMADSVLCCGMRVHRNWTSSH